MEQRKLARSSLWAAMVAMLAVTGCTESEQQQTGTASVTPGGEPTEWTYWGGDAAQTHFSPLTQITPENVSQLQPVWVYNPGTTGRGW